MAQPLVTKIETVLRSLKVTFINENSSLPDFEAAEDQFLKPILGGLMTGLYNVPEATPTELCKLAQRALVPLGYLMDLPLLHLNISDNGISITTSENRAPAPRWAFEKLEQALADKASMALERLIAHLYANREELEWTMPTNRDLIFVDGKAFNEYYTIHQPYRTFEQLRPCVMQAEMTIDATIGSIYYKALKAKGDKTEEELNVIHLVKCAVAQLTIKHAIGVLPVKITPDGFTATLRDNRDKANQGDNTASDTAMSVLLTTVSRNADTYLSELKKYLDANASETVFADYFTSDKYVAPVIEEAVKDKNENSPTFFL